MWVAPALFSFLLDAPRGFIFAGLLLSEIRISLAFFLGLIDALPLGKGGRHLSIEEGFLRTRIGRR